MKLKLIEKSVIVSELEKRIEETKGMQPKFDQFWAGQKWYKEQLKRLKEESV